MDPSLVKQVNAVTSAGPFVLPSSMLRDSDDAEDVRVFTYYSFAISLALFFLNIRVCTDLKVPNGRAAGLATCVHQIFSQTETFLWGVISVLSRGCVWNSMALAQRVQFTDANLELSLGGLISRS